MDGYARGYPVSRSLMSYICYPLQAAQATGNNLHRYHLSHHNFHKEYLQHHCKIHYIRNQMPQVKHSCFLGKPCRTRYSELHHQLFRINTPKHRIKRFQRLLKWKPKGEETRPSNKLMDSAMLQEIISFLHFIKSFVGTISSYP